MIRVAIYDDETTMLEGLETMIDWSSYGMHLVGTATNGIDALDHVSQERPDLVLTDIRMPGLTGLQLIERIKVFAPETLCIVFSGFNEFEYVRKAIHLGVIDYLEKPLTLDNVECVLKKTVQMVRKKQAFEAMKTEYEENQNDRLADLLLNLIRKQDNALEQWRQASHIWLPETDTKVVTALAARRNPDRPQTRDLFIAALASLTEQHAFRIVHWTDSEELAIIVFHEKSSTFRLAEWVRETALLHPMQAIGLGRTYGSDANIGKTFHESRQALQYSLFFEGEGLASIEDVEYRFELPHTMGEQEDSIIYHLRLGKRGEVLELVGQFMEGLYRNMLPPELIENECLKLVYLALEVCKESGREYWPDPNVAFLPHLIILELRTKTDMLHWLSDFFNDVFKWLEHPGLHKTISLVKQYIEQDYNRDISLQKLGSLVNMNPTYLSMLFKKETGQTFIKYLSQVRMDKARKLLTAGMKVTEVCEKIGYYDQRHFSELFKKHTGMTPGQFKGK